LQGLIGGKIWAAGAEVEGDRLTTLTLSAGGPGSCANMGKEVQSSSFSELFSIPTVGIEAGRATASRASSLSLRVALRAWAGHNEGLGNRTRAPASGDPNMKEHLETLPEKDRNLIGDIELLYHARDFDKAIQLINNRLSESIDISNMQGARLKAELAGDLIDIGDASQKPMSIYRGLRIYEQDKDGFSKHARETSIHYNIGNGYSSLFRVLMQSSGFKYIPKEINLLSRAKHHFWKAYRGLTDESPIFRMHLIINLANALDQCGRVTEALQYYGEALKIDARFGRANANRSRALLWLNEISNNYSMNLLWQAMNGYSIASQDKNEPDWMTELWAKGAESLRTRLVSLGWDPASMGHDIDGTTEEAQRHSAYRKFCIDHMLCLNEHSIYCNCIGASDDNLTIPLSVRGTPGDFVPAMELRLNRIKSEYSLARWLFYWSRREAPPSGGLFEDSVKYTELFDGEAIGIQPEMLRSSFRLCFGILDKIAVALCDLFDLADEREVIAFERFWRPRGSSLSIEQKARWSKINKIANNPALIALYSQATDLDRSDGQWGFLKDWRNALEHEILLVMAGETDDVYQAMRSKRSVIKVQYHQFENTTLHLLQFVRSAVFSFVYCVRIEGGKLANGSGVPIMLTHKDI